MKDRGRNLAASVAARLLHRAKQAGDDYQTVLANFCFERLLYRIGASAVADRFVLKGAMLLRVWSDRPYRATRDLDLLRRGDGTEEALHADLRTICATEAPLDTVLFEVDKLRFEPLRVASEYVGMRIVLPVRQATARLSLQIDVGLGDAVFPTPQPCTYPALLEFAAPRVLAYPREAVIAEKLEANIVLGARNSRIKDAFDLHFLASCFEFDRATLAEAVRKTFARRATEIAPGDPIGLTEAYWHDP